MPTVAVGRDAGVIVIAAQFTPSDSACCLTQPFRSLACTMKLKEPTAVVVPLIRPAEENVMPAGSVPDATVQV